MLSEKSNNAIKIPFIPFPSSLFPVFPGSSCGAILCTYAVLSVLFASASPAASASPPLVCSAAAGPLASSGDSKDKKKTEIYTMVYIYAIG